MGASDQNHDQEEAWGVEYSIYTTVHHAERLNNPTTSTPTIMSTDVQSSQPSTNNSLGAASTTSVIDGNAGRAPNTDTHPGQTGTGTRRDTEGSVEPAEEEGGAARGTADQNADTQSSQKPPEPEGGYPEQLHAGKLDGYGPEYAKMHKATMGDRLHGAKEYVEGMLKRDAALQQDARDTMSGKKKEQELADVCRLALQLNCSDIFGLDF